jgi:hypothetical protein
MHLVAAVSIITPRGCALALLDNMKIQNAAVAMDVHLSGFPFILNAYF